MKYTILLIIFAVSLIASAVLTLTPTPTICTGGGCESVQTTPYAYTLGIKNSTYGIWIFTFLILVTLEHLRNPGIIKKRTIHTGVIMGSIIALYFIYLQAFVIKSWCKYCLIVDAGMLIGILILLRDWKK